MSDRAHLVALVVATVMVFVTVVDLLRFADGGNLRQPTSNSGRGVSVGR